MAGNTFPLYPRVGYITAANYSSSVGRRISSKDTDASPVAGVGVDQIIFVADATNGSFVQKIIFTPVASSASLTTIATVFRVYATSVISGGTGTDSNWWNIGEISAYVQLAAQPFSAVSSQIMNVNTNIPPGYGLVVTSSIINTANVAFIITTIGGHY